MHSNHALSPAIESVALENKRKTEILSEYMQDMKGRSLEAGTAETIAAEKLVQALNESSRAIRGHIT
jgi:hypothetical protein